MNTIIEGLKENNDSLINSNQDLKQSNDKL